MTFFFVALAGGVLLALWGWRTSNMILHGPPEPITTTPQTYRLDYSSEKFTSADGTPLQGWFVPSGSGKNSIVVICHGWGANRSNILERTFFLRTRGDHNIFFFDFRQHGESGGARTSLSKFEIEDLRAALQHVRSAHGPSSQKLGLYGMSMGAAVALWVAAEDPSVIAVAAESSFSTFSGAVVRYGRRLYHAPSWLSAMTLWFVRQRLGFDPDQFAPINAIGRISPRPVFLLQGEMDTRTPPDEGRRLYAACGEPKTLWTLPLADHGHVAEVGGTYYQDRVLGFFAQAFAAPPERGR